MGGKADTIVRSVVRNAGLAWLRSRRRADRFVLLLPPAGEGGSLGDEAMVCAVAGAVVGSERQPAVDLVMPDGQSRWSFVRGIGREIDGFNLLAPFSEGDRFRFHRLMSRYRAFYCLGADVMDGRYSVLQSVRTLRLLAAAARLGLDARLLGFSWSGEAHPQAARELRALPPEVKLFVRDPVSHRRLRALGIQATPVADVAFLLEPDDASENLAAFRAWSTGEREGGRLLVGVNLSAHAFGRAQAMEQAVGAVADALAALLPEFPGLSVVAMPHDRRDVAGWGSDLHASEELVRRLAPALGEHAFCLPADLTAAQIKAAAGRMDLVLTSRMHLAIASLGGGVPVACIPYMGKFEGLLEHFAVEGATIEPDRAVVSGELSAFLAVMLNRREELRHQIGERLPEVRAAAALNLAGAPI